MVVATPIVIGAAANKGAVNIASAETKTNFFEGINFFLLRPYSEKENPLWPIKP